MINTKVLDSEIAELSAQLTSINDFLSQKIEGNITCSKSNGYPQYLLNGKYLRKQNFTIAKQICLRDYYKKIKPILVSQISELKKIKYLQETREKEFYNLTYGRKLLIQDKIHNTQNKIMEFESTQYIGKPFLDNDITEYYTAKGERVRSKSEILIANELYRHNIPYKYEMPLTLQFNNKSYTFYPDFTVMNTSTGSIKYIEHFGMLDNNNYYQNTLSKLDVFEKNGLIIGRDIIILHESSAAPLSTKTINTYLNEYLL